jgi:hypothetical protein
MRINGTIDPVAQLRMLLKVYKAVDSFAELRDDSPMTASVREAAVWARDVQFSDSITQLNEFEVHVSSNHGEYVVEIGPSREYISERYSRNS